MRYDFLHKIDDEVCKQFLEEIQEGIEIIQPPKNYTYSSHTITQIKSMKPLCFSLIAKSLGGDFKLIQRGDESKVVQYYKDRGSDRLEGVDQFYEYQKEWFFSNAVYVKIKQTVTNKNCYLLQVDYFAMPKEPLEGYLFKISGFIYITSGLINGKFWRRL
jgi:hypothetical protein